MKTKKILIAAITSLLILTACTNTSGSKVSEKSEEASSGISAESSLVSESTKENSAVSSDTKDESADASEKTSEDISEDKSEPVSDKSSEADSEPDSSVEESSESSGLPEIIDEPVCRSSMLYCVEDKKILYNDSGGMQVAPASITKLLTASVVLKNMDAEDIIEVGSELDLVHEGSSVCFIAPGHRLTVNDLLTGMLLCSGNDAAYTAAVTTARAVHPDMELSDREAVDLFVEMMNQTAAEIGMTDSHFETPDGWDEDGQYVTSVDLIKLAEYALSVPEIRTIVGTYEKYVVFESGENITWTNSNKLIDPNSKYYCENAIGMKTGTTDNSGNSILSAFSKDGKTYIISVLGCETGADRYKLTLKLFDLI